MGRGRWEGGWLSFHQFSSRNSTADQAVLSARLNPFSPNMFSTSLLILGYCVFPAYLPRRAFPSFHLRHVFVVGVLERHRNHSFIVEPAAQTRRKHHPLQSTRVRWQQRQRRTQKESKTAQAHKELLVSTVSGSKTHSIQPNPCCIRHRQAAVFPTTLGAAFSSPGARLCVCAGVGWGREKFSSVFSFLLGIMRQMKYCSAQQTQKSGSRLYRCVCMHGNQMVFVIMPHTDRVFSHPGRNSNNNRPHTKNMETRTCGAGKLEERKKFSISVTHALNSNGCLLFYD